MTLDGASSATAAGARAQPATTTATSADIVPELAADGTLRGARSTAGTVDPAAWTLTDADVVLTSSPGTGCGTLPTGQSCVTLTVEITNYIQDLTSARWMLYTRATRDGADIYFADAYFNTGTGNLAFSFYSNVCRSEQPWFMFAIVEPVTVKSNVVNCLDFNPDGRIRKGTRSYIGNNVYDTTGLNQTKIGSKPRGDTITFGISIQNDSTSTADSFTVLATGTASAKYTVTYWRGTSNITAAVVAGSYTTPSLAPGTTYLVTARVKVKSSATKGSSTTRLVTITSVGDGTKLDAVMFTGKRK